MSTELTPYGSRHVPGDGPIDAKVMLIGEAPGVTENEDGRPFCGQSGQLLDRLLWQQGIRRDDIYVTNLAKYHVPGNEDPTAEDIERDAPELKIEMEAVAPDYIGLLGRVTSRHFLGDVDMEWCHGLPFPGKFCWCESCGWRGMWLEHSGNFVGNVAKSSKPTMPTESGALGNVNGSLHGVADLTHAPVLSAKKISDAKAGKRNTVRKNAKGSEISGLGHRQNRVAGERVGSVPSLSSGLSQTSLEKGMKYICRPTQRLHTTFCSPAEKQATRFKSKQAIELSQEKFIVAPAATSRISRPLCCPMPSCISLNSLKVRPIVFCAMYHPAAGLHSPALLAMVATDIQQFALMVKGKLEVQSREDRFPKPRYILLKDKLPKMDYGLVTYIDTEGSVARPWGLSFTQHPGQGFVILADNRKLLDEFALAVSKMKNPCVLHNVIYDISVLRTMGIALPEFRDTMILAHHLAIEPQGLKALGRRHAGMVMSDYAELIAQAKFVKEKRYLEEVLKCLPPEPIGSPRKGKSGAKITTKKTGGRSTKKSEHGTKNVAGKSLLCTVGSVPAAERGIGKFSRSTISGDRERKTAQGSGDGANG